MITSSTFFRSHLCCEVDASLAGMPVSLCGWVLKKRVHSAALSFVDIYDHSGVVQVIVPDSSSLKTESSVRVSGVVALRPDGQQNSAISSGDVEVRDVKVDVFSESETPPFYPGDVVDETKRIEYRYLDMRSSGLQRNLRVRSKINSALRSAMDEQGFVEVETPMLIASTPEGARDFVVPSRLQPGSFYALPQSPQIFKQLCMVGGLDRYYQIAHCLRDEDLRADRQFEFMQLDVEASFVSQDDVFEFIGHAVEKAAAVVDVEVPPIERMTYAEAMSRFGSDKPDVRFGVELVDLSDVFADSSFRAFDAEYVGGLCVSAEFSRSQLDSFVESAVGFGAKGMIFGRVERQNDDLVFVSNVSKFLSSEEVSLMLDRFGAKPGDVCFLVADDKRSAQPVLGSVRLLLGEHVEKLDGFHFLWVTDFPLFEAIRDGFPVPAHHPFTMPHPDDFELLEAGEYLSVRSLAYDLVLNGWEVGGGSVRIHLADVQAKIFSVLGISEEEAQVKFGFLLDAFKFGPPPHAGVALGIDRLVAILLGVSSIREVIAFPKSQSGADPLTKSPTPIDFKQLRELGLNVEQSL